MECIKSFLNQPQIVVDKEDEVKKLKIKFFYDIIKKDFIFDFIYFI